VAGTFAYKYNDVVQPFEMINNGHTYSLELGGEGYGGITYENAWYNLMNINVHSLSEHTWNGMQMPVELHMVHKRYDGDAILIVAIPVESPFLTASAMAAAQAQAAAMAGIGAPAVAGGAFIQYNRSLVHSVLKQTPPYMQPQPTSPTYVAPPATDPMFNPTIQAFLAMEPPPVNMKIRVPADGAHSYNLNSLLQGAKFYEYAGSLTAPPCAEIVTWLVRQDSVKASDKQLLYLHDSVYRITADFGNYRTKMPLNGRVVSLRQSIMEDQAPTAAPPVPLPGKPQQSDREFRAMKWAMDAMVIAKSATDYVKDLDQRVRSAADAHARALAPQPPENGQVAQLPPNPNDQLYRAVYPVVQQPGYQQQAHNHQSPLEMQKTAEEMARTLATAAREEIEQATKEISEKSKEAAIAAAREAADLVTKGGGSNGRDMNTLADSVNHTIYGIAPYK
jgi:carbonic anhydrase